MGKTSSRFRFKTIKKIGEGATGEAFIGKDSDDKIIVKKSYKHMGSTSSCHDRRKQKFMNEVRILKKLSGKDHFPKLIHYDVDNFEIYMSECGRPAGSHKSKIPKDWKKQLLEIVRTLKKKRIAHNDTSLKNTCVKDDTLYLIDFANSGSRSISKNLSSDVIKKAKSFKDAFPHIH